MLVFRTKLFDGFMKGTGSVYTQTTDSALLGSVERLTLGLVFSAVTGASPSLVLQLENSPDGTRWMNQSVTPEYNMSISSGDSLVYVTNFSPTTVPIAGHVRIRVAFGNAAHAGYLRLWAVGRSPAS